MIPSIQHILRVGVILWMMITLLPDVSAQTLPAKKHRAVYTTDYYVSQSKFDYTTIAKQITAFAQTDYDKAKSLYLWICQNIEYDRSAQIRTADEAWTQRKAVCQGYCELYYRMAETIDLKAKLIFGKCRHSAVGTDYEEHTWICVTTKERKILMDPTWGAGTNVHGLFVRTADPLVWFDTDAQYFVYTHLPKRAKNQFLDNPVTAEEFDAKPFLVPRFGMVGLARVPQQRQLQQGHTYTFTVEKHAADHTISLVNGTDSYHESAWTRHDETYTITITPKKPGTLRLVLTPTDTSHHIRKTILEYEVR